MAKKEQRTGLMFNHIKTDKLVVWITQYNHEWLNKESPNLYRVRCWEDLPDMSAFIKDTSMADVVLEVSGKRGLYFYFRDFFDDFAKTKRDRKEAAKNKEDWWVMILPSGFPDGVIPAK